MNSLHARVTWNEIADFSFVCDASLRVRLHKIVQNPRYVPVLLARVHSGLVCDQQLDYWMYLSTSPLRKTSPWVCPKIHKIERKSLIVGSHERIFLIACFCKFPVKLLSEMTPCAGRMECTKTAAWDVEMGKLPKSEARQGASKNVYKEIWEARVWRIWVVLALVFTCTISNLHHFKERPPETLDPLELTSEYANTSHLTHRTCIFLIFNMICSLQRLLGADSQMGALSQFLSLTATCTIGED